MYLVAIVFHFTLESDVLILIVTVPCHCLSETEHNLIWVLFLFWPI